MKKTAKTPAQEVLGKLGDQGNETALKPRRIDQNFAQSCDLHENRGAIQSHLGRRKAGRPTQGRNA